MTFNIRYNNPNDGENAWPKRKEPVANLVRFHQVDLLGVQEALKEQMDDLAQLLTEFNWIGLGRDDGREKGEYSAILFRKDRFALLQQQTFWLSATPEQPGSIGWDAAITRVCTWGKFKDRQTGKIFFLFNTHFDHIGQRARVESARLILQNVQALVKTAPAIITGDFNANETSLVYETMTAGATQPIHRLRDARVISQLPHYGPLWTFHGFGAAAERPLIDYIFGNARVTVLRHTTIAEANDGRYASDHLPVMAEVVLD
jgi:endonuclease/exonuclease/phosphatase family metal-dependent hydrolase